MTRHHLISTALAVLFGVGGLCLTVAAESAKPALAKKDLKAAITSAKSPQDHQRIAAYYKKQADRLLAEAKEHDELAAVYAKAGDPQGSKHPMAGQTVDHCKYFAEATRKAAQEMQSLAKLHEDIAK